MRSVIVGVVMLVACHREGGSGAPESSGMPAAPSSTAELDALWAQAPDGAMLGIVASPRAVGMAEHAFTDVRAFMASVPELAPYAHELDAKLAAVGAKGQLADLGFGPAKGGAVFVGHDPKETWTVIPLIDRDKFLATVHGTKGNDTDTIDDAVCKTVNAYYVCVNKPEQFARLGKGNLRDRLAKLGTRGDIESIGIGLPGPTSPIDYTAAVQLAPGAVAVRVAVTGLPPQAAMFLAKGGKPVTRGDHAAGFALIDFRGASALWPPPAQMFAKTLAGPLSIAIPNDSTVEGQLPLSDLTPWRQLMAKCASIPAPPGIQIKAAGDACEVSFSGKTAKFWLGDSALRFAIEGGSSAGPVMSTFGAELARTDSTVALWGRGTLLGMPEVPHEIVAVIPPQFLVGMRLFALLDEAGLAVRMDGDTLRGVLAVRTAWANPPEVVAKIVAIKPEDLLGGRTAEAAKAIAAAAPGSPFAADLRAGYGGMMLPVGLLGAMSAVAIPAFMDYMKKSKKTEAALELNKLAKHIKMTWAEKAALPVGSVLTPTAPCCQGPQAKCPADPDAWAKSPIWSALEFSIDHPALYQYGYHSDGKTFTAIAVGDLDCDGTAVTYELHGEVVNGNIETQLTEPPPGAD